jgi:carboxyl-terminal processing protease
MTFAVVIRGLTMIRFAIRFAICFAICFAFGIWAETQPLTPQQAREDFDVAWTQLRDRYAYFQEARVNWDCVRQTYRPQAETATDDRLLIQLLEKMLDELHDPHTHLDTNLQSSYRIDAEQIWAEFEGVETGRAIVKQVRHGSAAAQAGIQPGHQIVRINGLDVQQMVSQRMPKCVAVDNADARNWALRSVIAGQHRDTTMTLKFSNGQEITYAAKFTAGEDPVFGEMRTNGLGYIRIPNFSDPQTVGAVDRVLEQLRAAQEFEIDVRGNPGGDTIITRPILGRFIDKKTAYAKMTKRIVGKGFVKPWTEFVMPRGQWTAKQSVIVRVDRWTMSAAEGFAMAFQTMGRGRIVGTKMAGLSAGIARFLLPNSKIGVQYSAEPVQQLDGRSRSLVTPD